MMSLLLVFLVTSFTITSTHAQCFSTNDRQSSQTGSIPSVVSQLLDGYSEFAFSLLRSVDDRSGHSDNNLTPLNRTQTRQQSQTSQQNSDDQDDDEPAGNVFLSPASVWSALLVTHLGARGTTESQIGAVLGIAPTTPKVGVAKAYHFLKTWYYLRAHMDHAPFTFRMANHIYLQEGQPVRPCLGHYLGDDLDAVDFASQPDASRRTINAWVEGETESKIRDLLPGGSVNSDTRIVLVNAAYFKGTWELKFDTSNTERAPFFTQPGDTDDRQPITVDMMRAIADFRYIKSTQLKCELIELPYVGGQLSMFVLLPAKSSSVDSLIERLTGTNFGRLTEEAIVHRVRVSLPKFKMEESLELRPHLAEMGVVDLFDPMRSDLSGFNGEADLRVGSVRHKAFVEVSENGTEASAATGFLAFRDNVPANEFRVDRPFVFVIRDNLLDTVLFVGALRRPEPTAVKTKRQGKGTKRRLSLMDHRPIARPSTRSTTRKSYRG